MIIPTFARVGIIGYTGCGKTILADWLARQWLPTAGAVFISDPKWDPEGSPWEGWGITVHDGAAVADAWLDGHRIIRLAGVFGDENLDMLEIAASVPRARVIIDESATLLPSDIRRCPESFQRITNQGRVQRQGIMLLGQHYAQLPAAYRLQSFMFAANQMEGTGKAWARERCGDVETVPQYHWLVSSPDGQLLNMDPVSLVAPVLVKKLKDPV